MSTNKPQVSLTSVSTGEGPSMITTINFSGGLLKDTRLERQDGSRGHSLVVHGQHEVEEFFTGIVCAAARFETWKKRVAGETADSVAGVEDVEEDKEEEGGGPVHESSGSEGPLQSEVDSPADPATDEEGTTEGEDK